MPAKFNLPDGYRLLEFSELDSTNMEAARRAKMGEPSGLWILAHRQTTGKGRNGRAWISEDGNLFTSLLLRPQCSLATATQLSLVAAVSACKTLIRLIGDDEISRDVKLKWPNDLHFRRKKIGGILLESAQDRDGDGIFVVIGTGINLISHPDGLDQPATDLHFEGCEAGRDDTFQVLIDETARQLEIWNDGRSFQQIRKQWLDQATGLGHSIKITSGYLTHTGVFADIDESGALILETEDSKQQFITAGDLTIPDTDD